LIISTDPAHNLSDAFGQQFGPKETKVEGIDNLYAMEIDPKFDASMIASADDSSDAFLEQQSTAKFFQELSSSFPGIDEAVSFAELVKQIRKKDYECVILDTAPTGHTLRLLSFPSVLEKALGKMEALKKQFGGLFSNVSNMFHQNNPQSPNPAVIGEKMQQIKESVAEIKSQFENCDLATFVCVCIPEFLSLYETERLVQQLAKFGIDTHNIVINQILYPEKNSNCNRCASRIKMQKRYIEQFHDLYSDFHLVEIPLLSEEVRGLEKLKQFSKLLLSSGERQEEMIDVD